MYVLIENGYVTSYATLGNIVNGIEITEPNDLKHFEEYYEAYKIVNCNLVYDENKGEEIKLERTRFELRNLRQTECFDVIDRSKLWYDALTEEQLEELRAWYNAWLEVTETLVIPEKPNWI